MRERWVAWTMVALVAAPPVSAGPAAEVESIRQRASEAVARHPAERWNLDAFAATLPPGVDAAFGFVRDGVRHEAYPGILRGAHTTFATRAGNAHDRSLLLADLLRRQGIPVRFALGRLSPERGALLFERLFERATDAGPAGPPGKAIARGHAFLDRVFARAAGDYARVRPALGDALRGDPLVADRAREGDLDHVWVQAQVEGKWVDLDAAFRDAKPGTAYAEAASTPGRIPDDRLQTVTIRVKAETWDGKALAETTALETTLPALALLDRDVFLLHTEGGGPGLAGALGGGVAGASAEAWTPALSIDGGVVLGAIVSFAEAAASPARGVPPSGGLPFGRGGALGSAAPELVAEWLEVETRAPGEEPSVVRRALVDRAPPGWRADASRSASALRPLPRVDGRPTTPREIHDLRFTAGAHDLHAFARAVEDLASRLSDDGRPLVADPSLPLDLALWPFAVQNHGVVVASDHGVVPALRDSPDHALYAASPRLFVFTAGAHPDRGWFSDVDLRIDALRAVPRRPEAALGAAERRLWFGLLEGALEHEAAAAAAGATGLSRVRSTSGALAGSALARLDADRVARLPDAARAAVAGGAIVVASAEPSEGAAYWVVAPGGQTSAVLEGLHAGGGDQGGGPPRGGSGGFSSDPQNPTTWGTRGTQPDQIGPDRPPPRDPPPGMGSGGGHPSGMGPGGGAPSGMGPGGGAPSGMGPAGGAPSGMGPGTGAPRGSPTGGASRGAGNRPRSPGGRAAARDGEAGGAPEYMPMVKFATVELVWGLVAEYGPWIVGMIAANAAGWAIALLYL